MNCDRKMDHNVHTRIRDWHSAYRSYPSAYTDCLSAYKKLLEVSQNTCSLCLLFVIDFISDSQ